MIPFPTWEKSDPSDSSSGASYEYGVDQNGRLSCPCRGWTTKKPNKPRECKHTKAFIGKHGLKVQVKGDYWFVVGAGGAATIPGVNTPAFTPATKPKAKPLATVVAKTDGRKTFKTIQFIAPTLDPFVAPMLAAPFPEGQTLENFLSNGDIDDYAMEVKYDGERKIVANLGGGVVKSWSRQRSQKGGGKRDPIEFELPEHIKAAFAKLPLGSYDGELYVPGGISSDVRKGNKNGKSTKATEVFVVFDVVILLGNLATDKTYDERRELLTTIFDECEILPGLELAPSVVPNLKFVRDIFDNGGEGVIIKRRAAKYQPGKRSTDFIKVKAGSGEPAGSARMVVIGYAKGELGPKSRIMLRNPVDKTETTVAAMGGGMALVNDIAQNGDKYLGRECRIEYQFRTADGSYRHPRWDRWENE